MRTSTRLAAVIYVIRGPLRKALLCSSPNWLAAGWSDILGPMSFQMRCVGVVVRWQGWWRSVPVGWGRRRGSRVRRAGAPPASLTATHAVLRRVVGGFESYCITPRLGGSRVSVLYLFGGGFVGGIGAGHWLLIDRMADVVDRVEVPLYGLAPDFHHEDALPFLVAVYEQLMTERPGVPVVVMGDSSGGGLAVLLAQAVHDRGMTPPSRLVLLCPWLDLSLSNPGIGRVARRDPWLSRAALEKAARAWAPNTDLTHPSVSPLYGRLDELPPATVYIGTRDLLYPDVMLFCEQASAAGSVVQLNICPSGLHLYPLTPTPEGRAAADAIVDSLRPL